MVEERKKEQRKKKGEKESDCNFSTQINFEPLPNGGIKHRGAFYLRENKVTEGISSFSMIATARVTIIWLCVCESFCQRNRAAGLAKTWTLTLLSR